MSLFTADDIGKKKTKNKHGSVSCSGSDNKFIIGNSQNSLEESFGVLCLFQTIWFKTDGEWSTHDIILYVLKQIGPSRVWFTTWSISEYSIRQLYNYKKEGLILEMKGLFDYRNRIHKPAELEFLKQVTDDIQPVKCHAKVVVIENDRMSVTIVGSANLTNNPRIEAGVLSTYKEVADFEKSWILEELKMHAAGDTNNR